MEFKSLKEQYIEIFTNRLSISKDDLTDVENDIINIGYELMLEKLEDLKIVNDENRRISIELANLRSYIDDRGYCDESENDDDC